MQSISRATTAKPRRSKSLDRKILVQKARDFRTPRPVIDRAIEELYIALDSAVSLSCLILFRAGENDQLVKKEIDPRQYNDADLFRNDFTAICLLRKSTFIDTTFDRAGAALDSFKRAEDTCGRVNKRFEDLSLDPEFTGSNVWLLNALTRKIDRLLGTFNIDEFFDSGTWGPGVSTLVKGNDTGAPRKFREESGITKQLYPLIVDAACVAYPGWFPGIRDTLQTQEGNTVITVPKNAKTDRTIGIEPGLNTWFQLSAGSMIRSRLRYAGFNLNSDFKNQNAAFVGSRSGHLATVDFSAASDTISLGLVREILPPRWFTVLDSIRSHSYNLDKKWHPYKKFSAMGCGFTFELESLIFVSAALAVCEYLNLPTEEVSVFGDDIILPTEAYELYSQFCKFLGFTVNSEKSFFDGYFRESCGSYFFDGMDVKPIFLKDRPTTIRTLYKLINQVRTLSHRYGYAESCDDRFYPCWKYLYNQVPRDLAFPGPRSLGDSCIAENCDSVSWRKPANWIEGFLIPGLVLSAVEVYSEDQALLLARLSTASRERDYGNMTPLRSITRMTIKRSLFAAQWYNLGPWITASRSNLRRQP